MEGLTPSLVLGTSSGSLLLLVAIWLAIQRRPETGATLLAFSLATWGAAIVCANVASVIPSSWWSIGSEATALILPLYFVAFGDRVASLPRWALPIAAIIAGLAAILLLSEPTAFAADLRATGQGSLSASGALGVAFGQLPLYLAIGLVALTTLRVGAKGSIIEARRMGLVAAGLTCFLASATIWFGIGVLRRLPDVIASNKTAVASFDLTLFASSAGFLVAIALHAHRAPMRQEDRRILLAALYAPLLTATAAAALLLAGGPRINPVGFWRIVMVALIVLAILRHRLFEGEVRFKRTAIATLTLFGALGLALLAEGLVRLAGVSALTSPVAALGVGAVFAAGLGAPYLPAVQRRARVAFRALVEPHDPSRAQQLEIYRAALDARAARGASLDARDPELARLRASLGVDARDHDLLALFLARRHGASAPAFAPGERILDGTLVVEREIGAGASARVYEARDATGRAVAVKVQAPLLHGEGARGARAVEEARMLDGLRSSNVLRVVEVADRPEAFYVVTERAKGTLADRLTAGPIAPDEALRLARDVLAGLAAAHRAGIVHRDVKPANILLADDGRAVLSDFDAAGNAGSGERAARGTPAWMAPEQFDPAGEVGPSADVHAVGALLFRMLAGRHYVRVDGLGAAEMRILVARAEPAIPAEWPADVRAWLSRALAKDPAGRYPNADAALAALPRAWVIP